MSISAMSSCWGEDFPVGAEGLSAPAVRVVALAVADVVNDVHHNEFYGSLPNLAAKVGLGRDTVRRVMKHLTDVGVITVRRAEEGRPTVYAWVWNGPREYPAGSETPRGLTRGGPRGLHRGDPADCTAPIPTEPNAEPQGIFRSSTDEQEFDEWWAVWPKKKAKGGARKQWVRTRKTTSFEVLMEGAQRVRDHFATIPKEEQRFTPDPERWLRKEQWLDEWTPPLPSKAPAGKNGSVQSTLEMARRDMEQRATEGRT